MWSTVVLRAYYTETHRSLGEQRSMASSMVFGRPLRRLTGLMVALMTLAILGGLYSPQTASANELYAADAEQLYFEQTGQALGGVFLEAWDDLGGVGRTGMPVSPAVLQGDKWVQWFEFARLEVPDNARNIENVTFAPAGALYAEKIGYKRWHPAFQPVAGAGDGARYFEDTRHSLANAMLNAWTTNDYETRLGKPISEEFKVGELVYQFFERGAFTWSEGDGVVPVPVGILDATVQGQLAAAQEMPAVAEIYGENEVEAVPVAAADGERWIDINLSSYVLTAYVGTEPMLSTYIVTGSSNSPTVTGEFYTNWKLESQTMEGTGWDGTPYRQEDVPHVMYFFADYAIHGAYWRDSFGYAASQGCVNVPVGVAAELYNWAPAGTRVVVHY